MLRRAIAVLKPAQNNGHKYIVRTMAWGREVFPKSQQPIVCATGMYRQDVSVPPM